MGTRVVLTVVLPQRPHQRGRSSGAAGRAAGGCDELRLLDRQRALAVVLWNGGISFSGVITFIFADLIIFPIINIYRKYYVLRLAHGTDHYRRLLRCNGGRGSRGRIPLRAVGPTPTAHITQRSPAAAVAGSRRAAVADLFAVPISQDHGGGCSGLAGAVEVDVRRRHVLEDHAVAHHHIRLPDLPQRELRMPRLTTRPPTRPLPQRRNDAPGCQGTTRLGLTSSFLGLTEVLLFQFVLTKRLETLSTMGQQRDAHTTTTRPITTKITTTSHIDPGPSIQRRAGRAFGRELAQQCGEFPGISITFRALPTRLKVGDPLTQPDQLIGTNVGPLVVPWAVSCHHDLGRALLCGRTPHRLETVHAGQCGRRRAHTPGFLLLDHPRPDQLR